MKEQLHLKNHLKEVRMAANLSQAQLAEMVDSMDNLILLILGLFISVLGITNIKGNISTIHSYNRRKVKEEDIPKYGKVVGTGTLIMGVSFILGYIALFWSETAMAVIILPGVVVGLGFMLYGQFKYNKGIF